MAILGTIIAYFCILLCISRWTSRHSSNARFFRAERRSPWPLVAFGMVGASISGITFVSVPGMVLTSQMTYLQLCLGFILGYFAIAFVLLPIYYHLNLTSIYTYLGHRMGRSSYLTGAWFFMLSKLAGAAIKFYVVCIILHQLVLSDMGIPFWLTVVLLVTCIWLYTRRGGIGTLVFTDTFQTFCLFSALILIIYKVVQQLDLSLAETVQAVMADERSRIFVFDGFSSPHNFWKQLVSGVFIVVVMTGLDQDMMQKNLTCRTLREAQKDMCSYGVAFVPANLLFLGLGILLAQLWNQTGGGVPLPAGDDLLPLFVSHSGQLVAALFTIGIVAASFSSADSALTSLTTCYCVDIRQRDDDEQLRRRSHLMFCLLFVVFILLFRLLNSTSLIDAIYTMVSYTYGPLLGLFSYGLFTRRKVAGRWVPWVCVASPLLCYALDRMSCYVFGYTFGYELLLLNGAFTWLGLWLTSFRKNQG